MSKEIAIIGLGNMGGALLKGLGASSSCSNYKLYAYDVHQDRIDRFLPNQRIQVVAKIEDLPIQTATLVLCIKPHDLSSFAEKIKGRMNNNTLVISILAGVTLDSIANQLEFSGAVVRSMPNIAATIGQAATAMCANESCTPENKKVADLIFGAVGEAYWTKESLMDTVTGLSGSGPAYIYMVIEALTDGGVKMGLPRDLSHNLATQTVLGAAALVKETGIHPAILRDQVTTPAGTTISALHELEERGLRSMFVSAVEKATARSRELGKAK